MQDKGATAQWCNGARGCKSIMVPKTRWVHAKTGLNSSYHKKGRKNWRKVAEKKLLKDKKEKEKKSKRARRVWWHCQIAQVVNEAYKEWAEVHRKVLLEQTYKYFNRGWEACAAGDSFELGWAQAKRADGLR